MTDNRASEIHQHALRELNGAALRALTACGGLHYRGETLYAADQPIPLQSPHLQLDETLSAQSQATQLRAVTDSVALRLAHSDAALHKALRPVPPIERLVFELLEQLRAETQIPDYMHGQRRNVRQRFVHWADGFYQSGLAESAVGLLLFTVTTMCWARLNSQPLSERVTDLIEGTRAGLVAALGTAMQGLRRHRREQAAFAEHAMFIAQFVHNAVQDEHALRGDAAASKPRQAKQGARAVKAFAFLLDQGSEGQEQALSTTERDGKHAARLSGNSYHAFTTQFDEQINAASLVRAEQLHEYRAQLDRWVQEQGVSAALLARRLRKALAQPVIDGWLDGEVEGVIDGARLAQFIAAPAEPKVFKHVRLKPLSACSVTVLIDCSGSMKTHTQTVAVLVDVLARALDMAGIDNEVLGYSTGAWHGGRAHRAWLAAGKPPQPGRLNEVSHRLFKVQGQRWQSARLGIAALLKPDHYREGIDGEAVAWACQRLLNSPASAAQTAAEGAHRHRILMVISDGCPMDSATLAVNGEHYLDQHLIETVRRYSASGNPAQRVHIHALGVGLDLSPYYPSSLGFDATRRIDGALLGQIVGLISRAK
jgi:cobaltochelatase CobT